MRVLLLLALGACALDPTDATSSSDLLAYPSNEDAHFDTSTSGVTFGGGRVLTGTPTLHLIYYGGATTGRRAILEDFLGSLGGSPLSNILVTYPDASGDTPTGRFTIAPAVTESRFAGDTPDDPQFIQMIQAAGPIDDTGLYIVAGDAHTIASARNGTVVFCQGAGGWHHGLTIGTKTVQFAFVGDPAACRAIDPSHPAPPDPSSTPNGDPDSDRMASVTWHEVAEAQTNPTGGGYHPDTADMCEGAFKRDDPSRPSSGYAQLDLDYAAANGAPANVHLGARDFALQPLWQNVGGGGCVRRLVLQRPAAGVYMTGDLNHSASPDLMFRNSSTREVLARMVDPSGNAGALTHVGTPTREFQVVGIADFDNDGTADILWRSLATGRISVWLMNGATPTSLELAAAGEIDPVWSIQGVGDFDGNGKADILFLNLQTNATRVWLDTHNGPLAAFTFADTQVTSVHPASTENVDVIGTGDFTGDRKSDIVWLRLDTNVYRLWAMNGTTATTSTIPSTGFDRVLGIVDVDGNLYADILGVKGTNVVFADPSGFSAVVGALPASEWRFVGGSRAAFGGSYLFWQNRETGAIHRWNVDSAGHKMSSTVVLGSADLDNEVIAY